VQSCPPPAEAARRIRRFADAYGMDDLRSVLEGIPRLCERNGRAMGRRGEPEHEAMWLGQAAHAATQLPRWLEALDR
jgi:hypothetical protein